MKRVVGVLALAALLASGHTRMRATERFLAIAATGGDSLRAWDAEVERLTREGRLRLRRADEDSLASGHTHERLEQYYRGVRVHGADVTRQSAGGLTVSVFGTVYPDLDLEVVPTLTPEDVVGVIARDSGVALGPERRPRLLIAPDEGRARLVYRATAFTPGGGYVYFVDARTGAIVRRDDAVRRQAAVGIGTGVLGDRKKVSTTAIGGAFVAADRLRPPAIGTYDLRGDLGRALGFLNGTLRLDAADYATAPDNSWTDQAAVDAHVYAGYVYDYYYKRFGRRGLDDNNFAVVSLVHPVSRDTVLSQPPEVVSAYMLNAGYFGDGIMVYGDGLPPSLTAEGQHWNYLSGGLDVVAHELTHGVTDYTSNLLYRDESGALSEAFSDMMGVAVEFFFQETGDGPLRADYRLGEDVITPGGLRSLADPALFGDPDHYSHRRTCPDDNGGVHTNSTIAAHAYYLAIEGGTNRTSGLLVHGVGSANRDQIEKIMYRAFTLLMPSNATFAVARGATIQAARDLYGAGSAAERAIAEAWTAVGVN